MPVAIQVTVIDYLHISYITDSGDSLKVTIILKRILFSVACSMYDLLISVPCI